MAIESDSGGAAPVDAEEAAVDTAPGQAASPVRVVLLGLGLLVLAGLLGVLLMPRGGAVSLEEVEAELFEAAQKPLPFDLAPNGARRLATSERVLSYTRALDADEQGSAPAELTVVDYPARRAESVLADQFKSLRFETGRFGGGGGGRPGGGSHGGGSRGGDGPPKPKLQDAGYLDWHGYRANYARLRHSMPKGDAEAASGSEGAGQVAESNERGDAKPGGGGAFYETVRVNLSTGGRCVIAYVRFPDNVVGSKDAVEEIVAAFRPGR